MQLEKEGIFLEDAASLVDSVTAYICLISFTVYDSSDIAFFLSCIERIIWFSITVFQMLFSIVYILLILVYSWKNSWELESFGEVR